MAANKKRNRPYKAANKRRVAKMVQPIAEGRKLTFTNTTSAKFLGEDLGVENWNVVVPNTWNNMYRENFLDTLANQPSSRGFTGKTLFSRFLNQQIKIRFDNINHYTTPVMVHVCYGYCKVPYLTQLQSSGSDSASNVNGVLIEHDRTTLITRLLSQMYNKMFPVTDPKQFKMMYNKKFQVRGETLEGLEFSDPADPKDTIQTIRKDLDYNITWKPNTKYHMRPATRGDGSDSASNVNGVLIEHDRTTLITRLLSQMYNKMFPVTDPKQFKMMYNKKFQVRGETLEGLEFSDPADPKDTIQTIRKDLDYNITWKPNTKYHMRPATRGDGSDGTPPPNDLSPDSGNPNFLTTAAPSTTSYWTPSAKNNGDLWTPFFAIQITNAGQFGRLPTGENNFTANPYLFQQNKHYFYDM